MPIFSGEGTDTQEDPLARLRRLRLAGVTEADTGGGVSPTGPVGPTGPTGPGPGGYTSPPNSPVPNAQSPDAQSRNAPQYWSPENPNLPVGPYGAQAPGNNFSVPSGAPQGPDQLAILQALGSQPAPTTAGAGVQSPDAVSRNFETNNPAPEGFEWKNGVLVQKPGTTTTGPVPTPSTVTPPTTTNNGQNITGGGAGTTTTTTTTDKGITDTGYKRGDKPLPGTDIQSPYLKGGADTTGGGGGGGGGGTGGTGGTQIGGQGGDLGSVTSDLFGQLRDLENMVNNPGAPADVGRMYGEQLTAILGMINSEEQQLRAEAEAAGTSLDPATEFTLSRMREELDRQLKSQQMAFNARGLFDSGILGQAEIDIRKGGMSDQAMVLSTRLSKIRDDLQQSLRSLSNRRLDVASEFGSKAVSGQLDENRFQQNRTDDAQARLLSTRLGLRGQLGGEEQSRQKLLAEAAENAASRQFDASENAAKRDLDQRLLQMRIDAGEYRGGGSGSSTALGGGSVGSKVDPSTGKTVTTYRDGSTSKGQEALQTMIETYGTDRESMYYAIAQREAKLREDGLTDLDIQRLYDAVALGPEGATPTGLTHGR